MGDMARQLLKLPLDVQLSSPGRRGGVGVGGCHATIGKFVQQHGKRLTTASPALPLLDTPGIRVARDKLESPMSPERERECPKINKI